MSRILKSDQCYKNCVCVCIYICKLKEAQKNIFYLSINCGINEKFKRIIQMMTELYPASSRQGCNTLMSSRQGLVVE